MLADTENEWRYLAPFLTINGYGVGAKSEIIPYIKCIPSITRLFFELRCVFPAVFPQHALYFLSINVSFASVVERKEFHTTDSLL